MISNAIIEEVSIGIEPDSTPSVTVIFENEVEFKSSVDWWQRCFSPSPDMSTRSTAEILGHKIFALAWVLDWCSKFSEARGQIVRVRWEPNSASPPQPFVTGIGHAVKDRWLDRNGPMQFNYPFYTGIPSIETAA